jgi:glycosyltransferase involved in cell wall biosynthesis
MGKFLGDAVNSVLACQDDRVELIIINDGSTDASTLALLQQMQDRGLNIIHQANQGLSTARNNAIKLAKGEYFIPLDADNKIRPDYIEKGIAFLDKHNDAAMVYGDAMLFGEKKGSWKSMPFNLRKLLLYNYIDACAVVRKKAWEQVNGYDATISPVADWDFNLSLAEAGWKLHYVPEILFDYRYLSGSMIRTFTDAAFCEDYVARKHGALYRKYFKEEVRLKGKIKYFFPDLWDALAGRR